MTMRNRKTVIVAFLIVAVMLMAVGFAALTDNLSIIGEATANTSASQEQWEDDIYFTAATVTASGTSGNADSAAVGQSNNDHANYYVKSLATKGEVAKFEFTIHNNGVTGYDALITVDTDYPTNTNSEYFKVTYSYGAPENGTNMTVPANGDLVVYVTVELIKTPDQNLSAQFTLNLTATSIES